MMHDTHLHENIMDVNIFSAWKYEPIVHYTADMFEKLLYADIIHDFGPKTLRWHTVCAHRVRHTDVEKTIGQSTSEPR